MVLHSQENPRADQVYLLGCDTWARHKVYFKMITLQPMATFDLPTPPPAILAGLADHTVRIAAVESVRSCILFILITIGTTSVGGATGRDLLVP